MQTFKFKVGSVKHIYVDLCLVFKKKLSKMFDCKIIMVDLDAKRKTKYILYRTIITILF